MRLQTEHEGLVVHVKSFGYLRARGARRLWFNRTLLREVRARRNWNAEPNIVVTSFYPGLPSAVRRFVRKNGWNSILVVDVRDIWPDAQLSTARGLQRLLLLLWATFAKRQARADLNAADALIAVSDEYLKWAVSRRTLDIPIPGKCVPIGATRMESGCASRTRVRGRAVFAGSVNSHFDFDSLLDAWSWMIDSWHEEFKPELVIVGQGSGSRRLRKLVEKRGEGVTFLGQVSRDVAFNLMATSVVGIAPYRSGAKMTSTNKVAEYLAHGLPVVCTLSGGSLERLAELGAVDLVKSENCAVYAAALKRRLTSDPQTFAETALRSFESELEANSVSGRYADFLMSLEQSH